MTRRVNEDIDIAYDQTSCFRPIFKLPERQLLTPSNYFSPKLQVRQSTFDTGNSLKDSQTLMTGMSLNQAFRNPRVLQFLRKGSSNLKSSKQLARCNLLLGNAEDQSSSIIIPSTNKICTTTPPNASK